MTSTSDTDDEENFPFEYQPIDTSNNEIRVIYLQALEHPQGPADEPVIRCTLENARLGRGLRYTALSYVWGDPNITKPISVNGRPFPATVNLQTALRQLALELRDQYSTKEMCLWVDAICINQSDQAEKTQQVSLMGQIFARASSVRVWLGPSRDHSSLAFQTLRNLTEMRYAEPLQHVDSWPSFRFSSADTFEIAVQKSLDGILYFLCTDQASKLSAIFSLLDRPWFRRVWVIQEVALSSKAFLACGPDALDWEDFWTACWVLMGIRDYLQAVMPHAGQRSAVAATTLTRKLGSVTTVGFPWVRGQQTLLLLLSMLATDTDAAPLEASDERDFVYGLLGLANDAAYLDIRPHYSKGWREIRVEVARKCLMYYGLDMLSFCGLQGSVKDFTAASPSWAPNWASGDLPRPLSIGSVFRVRGGWKKSAYSASGTMGQTVADWSFGFNGGLALSAVSVDYVSVLGGILPHKDTGADHETGRDHQLSIWLSGLNELLNEPNSIYNTDEKVAEALWKTPIADRGQVYNYETERATEDLRAGYQALVGDERGSTSQVKAARYAAIARRKLRRRQAFKTSEGYLGIGPHGMQVGDFVWIVVGTSVPLVLRRCMAEAWCIVGEAYVHGIMDGEMMGGNEPFKTINII
ncbi:Heterokaryon incompatibility protein [Lasiodiplodia theobromae]|uniref:Heterokaryon incompatibility protein n=1 Tax=Lasiodiplodia theobromae TaxID=45133 RepID=UPI0015C3D75B|nr:Heterokaryon incompatibility protein [Lasiodiplodia theobromae]KAF4546265.1 Heterokaryon incompatibility protein [Lasiodiplodia theobromae]